LAAPLGSLPGDQAESYRIDVLSKRTLSDPSLLAIQSGFRHVLL